MTKCRLIAATAWLAVSGLGTSLCHAQTKTPRFAHPGRVVDAAGEPIANAAVTFVSAPRLGASPDDEDVVKARTGADGRFRVDLVTTRHYRAWAVADGEIRRASQLVTATGPATELRAGGPPMPKQGTLENADTWLAHGAVALQFVVAGTSWAVPTVGVGADGSFAIPELPAGEVDVRMFCRDRLVLVTDHYSALSLVSLGSSTRIEELCAQVRDAKGVPIAEATVGQLQACAPGVPGALGAARQIDRWPLADVGTDGQATILLADHKDLAAAFLRNASPADDVIATTREGDFSAPGRRDHGFIRFSPYREAAVPGRVHNAPPDAGVRFLATPTRDQAAISPWLPITNDTPFPVPLDWEMKPELRAPYPRGVWIGPWQPKLAPEDPFARVAVAQPVLVDQNLLTAGNGFDFATIAPVRLQVHDAGGAPAIDADVYVLPRIQTEFADPELAMRMHTDASGRCLAGLAPGGGLVFVEHAGEFAWVEVEPRLQAQVDVRLQALARMRVRVVDAAGKPLPNQQLRGEPRRRPTGNDLARTLAAISLRFEAARPAPRTDREGRTELRFLPVDGLQRHLIVEQTRTGVLLQPSETEVELSVR